LTEINPNRVTQKKIAATIARGGDGNAKVAVGYFSSSSSVGGQSSKMPGYLTVAIEEDVDLRILTLVVRSQSSHPSPVISSPATKRR